MSGPMKILVLCAPLPFLILPTDEGTFPLWQTLVCYFVLVTTILIGSQLGAWFFAHPLPPRQRLTRRLPYSIGMLTFVIWNMHATFGFSGSIPIVIAAIPGLIAILFDVPAQSPHPDE